VHWRLLTVALYNQGSVSDFRLTSTGGGFANPGRRPVVNLLSNGVLLRRACSRRDDADSIVSHGSDESVGAYCRARRGAASIPWQHELIWRRRQTATWALGRRRRTWRVCPERRRGCKGRERFNLMGSILASV